MSAEIAGLLGGVVGGLLGAAASMLSAYWGPRYLEEWRETRAEQRLHGPRKALLKTMLEDPRFPDGRTLETLARTTGTAPEECRRLLVEISARGLLLKGDVEGWALISRKPLVEA